MKPIIRILITMMALSIVLAGCKANKDGSSSSSESEKNNIVITSLSKINMEKWNYNSEKNVYWQIQLSYSATPMDKQYETLGIFVPGEYMEAIDNKDGTFTCKVNTNIKIGNYTSKSAPIVFPINTPGYSAMPAPTGYVDESSLYTKEGFIYVSAGCRGRDAGAPAGVTDLKAAVRYIRYNENTIPGNMDCIFTFGMSGGGAQSALMGSTGDSDLYTPYLESIGVVQGVSDAVAGSMCWCPITNLDYANEAYEWNLGHTRTDLDDETRSISKELSKEFVTHLNQLGLKDSNGTTLTLENDENNLYQAGSYYDYLKATIEESLNDFLSYTSFPYTVQSTGSGDGMGGGRPQGGRPNDGELPEGFVPPNKPNNEPDYHAMDGIDRNTASENIVLSGTYETVADYINALNSQGQWVIYDSNSNTATISNIADFVSAFKPATKGIGAFDALDASQGENILFGYSDGKGAHFDQILAKLVENNTTYSQSFKNDLSKKDYLGNTVDYRVNMYNPMYFLVDYYDGYQTSNVVKYWRIRTGINQSDTALTTEVNLALALENYGKNVDFETVWGQGHTLAEQTRNSTENFIMWIHDCLK